MDHFFPLRSLSRFDLQEIALLNILLQLVYNKFLLKHNCVLLVFRIEYRLLRKDKEKIQKKNKSDYRSFLYLITSLI